MNKVLVKTVKEILDNSECGISLPSMLAFMAVESGGKGFDPSTGKIMIQFEPHIFSSRTGIPRSKLNNYHWDENKVDVQSAEWKAFNEAFKIDPNKAMESTSIGLPQIMGFHWKRLGYNNAGEMWDDFKKGEREQIQALIKFILTDSTLYAAVQSKDWHRVALNYNGRNYREQAAKLGIVPYDQQMDSLYDKYCAIYGW